MTVFKRPSQSEKVIERSPDKISGKGGEGTLPKTYRSSNSLLHSQGNSYYARSHTKKGSWGCGLKGNCGFRYRKFTPCGKGRRYSKDPKGSTPIMEKMDETEGSGRLSRLIVRITFLPISSETIRGEEKKNKNPEEGKPTIESPRTAGGKCAVALSARKAVRPGA